MTQREGERRKCRLLRPEAGARHGSGILANQNPLPPPPPLPPPLDPPPPDPDPPGLDDMLLAAALDMLPMLCEKLTALNCPVPSTYQVGGSRYMFSNAFAHLSATPNAIAYGRKRSNISGDVIGIRIGDQVLRIDGVTVGSPNDSLRGICCAQLGRRDDSCFAAVATP